MRLEPLVAAHAGEMFEVLSDPAIYQFIEDQPPQSVEALRARYEKLQTRKSLDSTEEWLNWVVRNERDRLAGYVQATVRSGIAWIAFVLSSADWGKGLAQQATRQMIEILKTDFEVTHLLASVDQRNARSLRLLQTLSFSVASNKERAAFDLLPSDVLLMREA
ncbi:MAG: GNAT family N-acetyltransferase [Burkholderiaceae bacterium]